MGELVQFKAKRAQDEEAARRAQRAAKDAAFRRYAPRCPNIRTPYLAATGDDRSRWDLWWQKNGSAAGCINPDGGIQRWMFPLDSDDLTTEAIVNVVRLVEVFR